MIELAQAMVEKKALDEKIQFITAFFRRLDKEKERYPTVDLVEFYDRDLIRKQLETMIELSNILNERILRGAK